MTELITSPVNTMVICRNPGSVHCSQLTRSIVTLYSGVPPFNKKAPLLHSFSGISGLFVVTYILSGLHCDYRSKSSEIGKDVED